MLTTRLRTLVTRGRTSFYTPISIYPKRILSHLNYSTTNPQGENTNNKIADNTYTAQNITQETDKNTEQESRDTENANTENSHEKDSNAEQKQQQRKRTTLMDRLKRPSTYVIPISVGILFTIFFSTDYAQKQREATLQRSQARNVKVVGKPLLGGSFTLVDTDGNPVTDSKYRGKYLIVYFGFTNCPDICPEEMKKIATVMDTLDPKLAENITPLFITLDPNRDSCKAVEEYVSDFHPKIIGLTGTPEQIKDITKKYRVYYSLPESTDQTDYLIDHSMYVYFMGPMGHLKEYFARAVTAKEMKDKITQVMKEKVVGE